MESEEVSAASGAENPALAQNEDASGSMVGVGGSLLYDSIGSLLSSKNKDNPADEGYLMSGGQNGTEGSQTAKDIQNAYFSGTFLETRLIGQILMDRNDEENGTGSEEFLIPGFSLYTETASRNTVITGPEGSLEATLLGGEADDGIDPDSENVSLDDVPLDQIEFLNLYTRGTYDRSVAYIQQRLMDLGFMDSAEPTEYYGSATMEAVRRFQRQNDLKQDGIMGSETIAMLISPDAKSYLLRRGMTGDDITAIQKRLYELGYLSSKNLINGSFDSETEDAVRALQTANSISSDGKIGSETLELVYSEDVKANIISFGDKSDVVKACQERLRILGYMTTVPDGLYGNDTLAAVKLFQSKNDLVVDGYLGPTTREVLDSASAVANGLMLGDEGDTVKRVQELLIKYGYMKEGSATGYFGEVTDNAVKAFQRANGLKVDGDVGSYTMAKLTGGEAVKAGQGSGSAKTETGTQETTAAAESSSDSGSVAALISVAKSKLGCRYSLGAKGPDRFDCSGFVYWCLNQVGVKQSYITSYGWRSVGKYRKITSFSSLKAGDIIVVSGHVGIIAYDDTVIDASSTNGKIVHRNLSSWWRNKFICGWRIFD